MMRALRDVKVDNNSVGWYQCSYLGSFCTKDTIAHQVRARARAAAAGRGACSPSSARRHRNARRACATPTRAVPPLPLLPLAG